jgi:hypothetical protein
LVSYGLWNDCENDRAAIGRFSLHAAIVCDLAEVGWMDPLCAGVFTAIPHSALGWPSTALVLCAPPAPGSRHPGPPRRGVVCGDLSESAEALAKARARACHYRRQATQP